MFKGKALLTGKTEVTYGTDPTPAVNTDAILCESLNVEPVIRSIERPNFRSYLGALTRFNIGEAIKINFTTELKGSGTAGTEPEIGKLFRACGYSVTTVALTSNRYDPNSNLSTAESVTLWYYFDGVAHKAAGCRGTFAVDLKSTEYGKITWEFTGIYQGPADLALGTGTFNATVPPRFVSAAFAVDSYAGIIETIKINAGNGIAMRKSANAATGILEYFINDRVVTGEIDPEMITIATKDLWAILAASTRVAFTAAVTGAAGNICTITGGCQFSNIKYGDREGLITAGTSLVFTPTAAGNDEIRFMFT